MCRFVLLKCCELEICNSHCSVAEGSVFWHVTLCCWANGSMMDGYSGTNATISVYHLLEGIRLPGLFERKEKHIWLPFLDPEDIQILSLGAIWNFGKGAGLS